MNASNGPISGGVAGLLAVFLGCLPAVSFAQVEYVRPIDWSRYSGVLGVRDGVDALGPPS